MLRNTIAHGDCIEAMSQLPAGSVDLAFADPPFNIGFSYDVYADELPAAKYLAWSRDWMRQVHRALQPHGTFWLAIGDEYAAELKVEAQQIGFHCRSWVIWYYTFGVNCKQKFTRSHAHLFHFVKDADNFVFRASEPENRIPSARQLVYNDTRANPRGRLPDDTWIIRPEETSGAMDAPADWQLAGPRDDVRTWTLRPQDLENCFQSQEDTWYFPRVAGTFKERAGFHGCQMPEQLLGRLIRACSAPGDLVLDPFSGSGTTVAVAKKLGRDYLAFDLSPEYVRLGQQRLEQIRVGDALDGSAEPLVSAPRTGEKTNQRKKTRDVEIEGSQSRPQWDAMISGVRDAFARTHAGLSADRVVADPDLNQKFLDACRSLGIGGDPRTWNILLFRLRKAGQLPTGETRDRTSLDWQACDPFLFASEIAWQQLLGEERAESLDEILCDPTLAASFDGIARQFAPGHSSFHYRWGALKLRKQSSVARQRAQLLLAPRTLGKAIPVREFDCSTAPESGGVYLIGGVRKKLYVGETLRLQSRLKAQFTKKGLRVWERSADQYGLKRDDLRIWVRPLASEPGDMLAWQSRLVSQFRPLLNLRQEK